MMVAYIIPSVLYFFIKDVFLSGLFIPLCLPYHNHGCKCGRLILFYHGHIFPMRLFIRLKTEILGHDFGSISICQLPESTLTVIFCCTSPMYRMVISHQNNWNVRGVYIRLTIGQLDNRYLKIYSLILLIPSK